MLHAIESSKISRAVDHEYNWKEIFNGCEDSLTSSVFERLFYLPDEMFWDILTDSCSTHKLPKECESIQEKEFWPHWETGNDNSNYIEPDIFIRFNKFDLIIEVKRDDNANNQNANQWEKQIDVYKELYEAENKPLYFIALGGNRDERSENIEKVKIIKASWTKLLYAISKKLQDLKKEKAQNNYQNILADILIAFRLHGFAEITWLKDEPELNVTINYRKAAKVLENLNYKSHGC